MLVSSKNLFADEINWEHYKIKFVTTDGRIVDTGNGHISHSEGQGFGMLLAVAHDDRDTFEKIWQWTEKNLGIRDDGLFVWRWLPDQEKHYQDMGSASDGDVLIAWAMTRAAKKWGDPAYINTAKKLAEAIRKQLIAEIYEYTLLLPGPAWPRRNGYTVINLSYWIYPAFQELGDIDASPLWEKLARSGINLIERARFGKWELPADWFALKNDGSVSQLDDFPFVFGYEAVRIPLYYLWGGYSQKDLLRVFQAFWSSTAKGNKLVTILGLAMDSTIQQENVLAYRAVSELVECAITGEPASILDENFADYHDYYSATLFLIAQQVAKERMPFCKTGAKTSDIKQTCMKEADSQCPLSDPIHAKIENGNIIARVEDFIQIPPTNSKRPLARIGYMTHANDGSGRLFVIDEEGKIYIIKDGKQITEPFLDIAGIRGPDFYADNPGTGIKSIDFHPDFENHGTRGYQHLYTAHTERKADINTSSDTPVLPSATDSIFYYDVISEWRINPDNPDAVMRGSNREILRIAQPEEYNNVEHIGFDHTLVKGEPDYGLLFISIGDGGVDGDNQRNNPQNMNNYFGKIIRIDSLPEKQKLFFDQPVSNLLIDNNPEPEIWAYGFHDPRQFSWDIDGKMYIVDAGWKNIEEVNIGIPGANYGWNYREGTFAVKHDHNSILFDLPSTDQVWNFTYPVIQYDHDEGISITGGFVYRGKYIPELYGNYIFGDAVNGRIFYIDTKAMPVDMEDMSLDVSKRIQELRLFYKGAEKNLLEILNHDSRADLSLGQDEDGEIYILTMRDGMIRKLLPLYE